MSGSFIHEAPSSITGSIGIQAFDVMLITHKTTLQTVSNETHGSIDKFCGRGNVFMALP